jgi:hypothetical protein
MAIISNVRNDGKSYITTGPKNANSYNVSPVNFVATASPGTKITVKDSGNYEYFNAAQTSAGTDLIVLDTALPVGTEIWFYCISACKVIPTSGDSNTINGGTNGQGISLVATNLYSFNKTSPTTWICGQTVPAGTFSAPVPS